MDKKTYYAHNDELFKLRAEQLHGLFNFLNNHINLTGQIVVSVGCGVAADLHLLKGRYSQKIGIDANSSVIDYCKKQQHAKFIHARHSKALDDFADNSVDMLLALDIDSHILPQQFIKQALPKLKKNGTLILTERQHNEQIYHRMLLLPFIEEIKEQNKQHNIKVFTRLHDENLEHDRDNVVLIVTKQ
ncbi:hypothetical protein COV18_04825 [Candidatus Woesearchaeota archaeon CG10_big_fil_rev_8_21_14_0_10_37_12]|nr:MAG: hypothetical protein COV18_04825 [Candidatus Woesearchaeota archaeon CG10_big_fil_rev_8_21_14_0_10_37_12]